MRALIAAVRFLTRVPLPGPATTADDLPPAVAWYPLVGAAVGAAIGGAYLGLAQGFPAPVAAVLAVAAGLLLTGGFHEDGATDAGDGLGGGWTRERVLEIMKDSRIGAYGAMALWCLLSLRAASLVALGALAVPAMLLAMCWGRWSASFLTRLPAIGSGLAKEVSGAVPGWAPWLASAIALGCTALACHLGIDRAPWAACAALLAAVLWAAYLMRRLGGQSGDLLGAGNQLVEASVLLAVLWGMA